MIRFTLWLIFYIVLLGAVSVKVKYSDGLSLNFKGWLDYLLTKETDI